MRLATLKDDSLDGRLLVVSRDGRRAVAVPAIAPNLLDALQRWDGVKGALADVGSALDARRARGAFDFDPAACAAPLPRGPQWLDGSAFLNHGRLMEQAFNAPPIPAFDTVPVMYQGASDDFLGPHDDVPMSSEADGIDFEGEFGVICGPVPMGVSVVIWSNCFVLPFSIPHFGLNTGSAPTTSGICLSFFLKRNRTVRSSTTSQPATSASSVA